MTARLLRIFTVSLLAWRSLTAGACLWEAPERWYMYTFGGPTFADYIAGENRRFWTAYCAPEEAQWWPSVSDYRESAERKNDSRMAAYLKALEEYSTVVALYDNDSWDYPTAAELAERRQRMDALRRECMAHSDDGTATADRWTLLAMRANMLLGDYAANVRLWETRGAGAQAGYVKERMRNVYANALLHTDRKIEAWNIYAAQNDRQSLVWSVRKYTNLAGIKALYAAHPDAPVHKYLLQKYVNNLQEVVDYYTDLEHLSASGADGAPYMETLADRWEANVGKAYPHIGEDYRKEIEDFVAFADNVAREGKTQAPCMWQTAAALCSYFIGAYTEARERIGRAMAMAGDREVKDMARRVRMLIATASDDIMTAEFRSFMATELQWLNAQIQGDADYELIHARNRILNLGLTKGYEQRRDMATAYMMRVYRDLADVPGEYAASTLINDIFPLKADDMKRFFDTLESPGADPLLRYVASQITLPADVRNDLLGTKLLQEGRWEEALVYLQQVDMDFLNKQAIAFYAARRDYRIPAWNGHQTAGDGNYEETQKDVALRSNVKVDFCRDMIRLTGAIASAPERRRDALKLEMAVALYQASRLGQCWYISQYGFTREGDRTPADTELAGRAVALLNECARSADARVKAAALFGLVYTAPDQWAETRFLWEDTGSRTTFDVKRASRQYALLRTLHNHLQAHPQANLTEISRCDVLRQWQAHR